MNIKPILFSTPMVQAILAGRKSMTRRVVKNNKTFALLSIVEKDADGIWFSTDNMTQYHIKLPYHTGDILWVRETWAEPYNPTTGFAYRASCQLEADDLFKWHPSIFMPKEAARIWLEVTDVRCERLQEITPHDAWLEGCRIGNSFPWEDHIPELQQQCRDILFVALWNIINAKRGYEWDSNPWVWVISFDRCDKPTESEEQS